MTNYMNPEYVIHRATGNRDAAIARGDHATADHAAAMIAAATAQMAATA